MKLTAAAAILLALLLAPAPLLPPQRLAQAVQSVLGIESKSAYLAAAVGLQAGFYASLGALAAFAADRTAARWGRLLQIAVLPLLVVGAALAIRSIKVGHVPIWTNAAIPVAACICGAGLSMVLLKRGWKLTLLTAAAALAAVSWVMFGGASAELSGATEAKLRRLVVAGPGLPLGEARFGALLQAAFASSTAKFTRENPVQRNRAAILALGIAVGHERLARLAGLDLDAGLLRQAAALREGATLRGRDDWSRHYTLSAALAVLEHPLISDAGGLMKEQLDALTQGSGFSFGDLAADRAGVRFAVASTASEAAANAMQARLSGGFTLDDFFPPSTDLPENLTVEQFRRDYGGVGSERYRQRIADIEARLDRCAALSPPAASR